MVFGTELLNATPSLNMVSFYAPMLKIPTVSIPNAPPIAIPSISESVGDWTFTLNYDSVTDKFLGCGPTSSTGITPAWGVCLEYDASKGEPFIRDALREIMKMGQKTVADQKVYAQQYANWVAEKTKCKAKVKTGFTFSYVNKDKDYTPFGPPDDEWICRKTKLNTANEDGDCSKTHQLTNDDGSCGDCGEGYVVDEYEDSDTYEECIKKDESKVVGGSINIGFSEGLKETLKNGLIVLVVIGIGYGAYQGEKKSDLFSNIYKNLKKKMSKTSVQPKSKG